MRKHIEREKAWDIFHSYWGKITNAELARLAGVHRSTITRWKSLGSWVETLEKKKAVFKTQPIFWVEEAIALQKSAQTLLTEIQKQGNQKVEITFGDSLGQATSTIPVQVMLGKSYMLLVGLSLENLLKAILVLKHPEWIDVTDGKLKGIKSHDLVRLAQSAELKLDDADFHVEQFLSKTSQYVQWAGRYPVPSKFYEMKEVTFDPDIDPDCFKYIWTRAKDRLEEVLWKEKRGFFDMIARLNWP